MRSTVAGNPTTNSAFISCIELLNHTSSPFILYTKNFSVTQANNNVPPATSSKNQPMKLAKRRLES